MNKNYYAVIMAGGIGTRFWPMSTQEFPKQFHDILNTGETLIQQTADRLEKIIPTENILIATNKRYLKTVTENLPKVPLNNILLEPAMRNTAPCILYSAIKAFNENPEALLVIAPSDHYIENVPNFIDNLQTALDYCETNDALVTLGIEPTFPNTGYGYIKYEKSDTNTLKKVANFTEKPSHEKAEYFLNEGNYLWNAGIFIWSAKSILKCFESFLPEMFELFSKGNDLYNTSAENDFIDAIYGTAENISIDFGIMEKADNVYMLPATFEWNDLGTWVSLYDKLPKDENENATVGAEVIYRDSNNNMLRTTKGKKVVIQGLSDYIVIEKDDVLLICPKSQEQEIKEIREEVKNIIGDNFV